MFCAFRTGVLGSGKSFSQQLFTRDKRLGTSISVPMLSLLSYQQSARLDPQMRSTHGPLALQLGPSEVPQQQHKQHQLRV
jgi:hypothetical protein